MAEGEREAAPGDERYFPSDEFQLFRDLVSQGVTWMSIAEGLYGCRKLMASVQLGECIFWKTASGEIYREISAVAAVLWRQLGGDVVQVLRESTIYEFSGEMDREMIFTRELVFPQVTVSGKRIFANGQKNESAEHALSREVYEEIGIRITVSELRLVRSATEMRFSKTYHGLLTRYNQHVFSLNVTGYPFLGDKRITHIVGPIEHGTITSLLTRFVFVSLAEWQGYAPIM